LQAGSVKRIAILDDTTIEVVLSIDAKLKPFIPKNTLAAVATDGLVGDKIVSLIPGRGSSEPVAEGDLLQPAFAINKDELFKNLSKTNTNVLAITDVLKGRIDKIDTSALINLLNSRVIAAYLLSALENVNAAGHNTKELTGSLNDLVKNIKRGGGALGVLLADTSMAGDLKLAIANLKAATASSSKATNGLNELIGSLRQDIDSGNGSLHVLLKDTATAGNLSKTMENLKNGTQSFSQDMEALKHNFFLRGYFRRQIKAAQDSSRK
jgi:phospholipid/cholesterol/gamma-HCH transport system substrate-binding protein